MHAATIITIDLEYEYECHRSTIRGEVTYISLSSGSSLKQVRSGRQDPSRYQQQRRRTTTPIARFRQPSMGFCDRTVDKDVINIADVPFQLREDIHVREPTSHRRCKRN